VRCAVAVLLALAACDSGGSGRHHARPDASAASEQAAFDKERRPDLILAAIGLRPGDVVADVGAGTGLLTTHVARAVSPGGHVVATDVDATVLDLLESRMHEAGLDGVVDRRVVQPNDPGLEASTFDVILLSQVDNYFDDAAAWLRAAARALKPGGRIVITNRIHHQASGEAAARAAGLQLVRESTDIPGSYVAIYSATTIPGSP
jgi:ubiquinone/menaquinone biosynthesis C-methylase UbiE